MRPPLVAVAAIAALAFAGTALAQGQPDPAQMACQQIQQKAGDKFETLFGGMQGCIAKVKPAADAAVAKCQSAGHAPGSKEFATCIGAAIKSAIEAVSSAAKGGKADDGAKKACEQMKAKLGDKFDKQYGSVEKCVAEAQAILKACAEAGKPGSDAYKACFQEKSKAKAEGAAAGKSAEAAAKGCKEMKAKLGDKFDKLYGSVDKCVAAFQAAMKACAEAGKPGSDEFGKCLQGKLKGSAGGGNGSAQSAESAAKVCSQARSEMGADKFDKRFGSTEKCVAEVKAAMKSCADAGKPSSDAFKQCIGQKLGRR